MTSERPSLDTSDVRRASLSVDNWTDCPAGLAALWLDVPEKDCLGASEVGSIGELNFLRVSYGLYQGFYAILGDQVEEISEPCKFCEETGRMLEERHGGQSERWVPCLCEAGHGEPGEWS